MQASGNKQQGQEEVLFPSEILVARALLLAAQVKYPN
jgi:hypothetical protein